MYTPPHICFSCFEEKIVDQSPGDAVRPEWENTYKALSKLPGKVCVCLPTCIQCIFLVIVFITIYVCC